MVARQRFLTVIACAFFVVSSSAVAATDAEVEALRQQVAKLQARLEILEAQVSQMLRRPAPATTAGMTAPAAAPAPAGSVAVAAAATAGSATGNAATTPSAAYEAEAQALIDDVVRLTDEGQADAARARLAEFRAKYGASRIAGYGSYYANELEAIGKNVPADWGVGSWFQGPGDADLRGSAPTIVVFWEEWCPHCRDEMPKLQQLYARHRTAGLRVLGLTKVTQTSTDAKVQSFIGESGIQFAVGKESGAASTHFNVKGIPAAAIVRDGKIVWRGHPIRLTDEIVTRWLTRR